MRSSLWLALLSLGQALVLQGCTKNSSELEALKNQYPVVHYNGPKKPFTVSLQKSRPASWVSLGEVSKVAVGAIIVSEDWAFYQHQGIDTKQIKEALREDMEEGRFARGASTITQQVVKNVFLTNEKTITRKVNEIVLALKLEKVVPKRRILETYLNIAEWGEGVFGINKASQYYFKKHPSELTAKEGAFLAMLLPSPKRYSQSYRSKKLTRYASRTVNSILDKMTQARYLSAEDRAVEGVRRLPFEEGSVASDAQGPVTGSPPPAPALQPSASPGDSDEEEEASPQDNEA